MLGPRSGGSRPRRPRRVEAIDSPSTSPATAWRFIASGSADDREGNVLAGLDPCEAVRHRDAQLVLGGNETIQRQGVGLDLRRRWTHVNVPQGDVPVRLLREEVVLDVEARPLCRGILLGVGNLVVEAQGARGL